MKRVFIIILAAIAIMNCLAFQFCLAETSEIEILVDQKSLDSSVQAFIEDDRIFISARTIIEELGGRITWFSALKLLTINIENHIARLVIDDLSMELDDTTIPLETSAKIINNRVMIPLEVLQNILSIDIDWDNRGKVLSINFIKPSLLKIRSYSHDDKTRVVIDLSETTSYKANKLVNPDRIYVDIEGSILKLEDSFKKIDINDNTIKTIRAAKYNEETVRIVLELYQENKFDVFDLKEPERIVLDVFKTVIKKDTVQETKPVQTVKKETDNLVDLDKRVVIIDPGHGGSDPGAIGPGGLRESEATLKIALHLEKLLKNAGISCYLTRYENKFISLENRTTFANQKNGFVFISLHANSAARNQPTATGIETFVLSSKYIGASAKDVADRENRASRTHPEVDGDLALIIADLEESANIQYSLDLAEIVQKKLVEVLKLKNRGVKQAPFVVLKGANMAAVLVEVAFISNSQEEKLLRNNDFSAKAAQALFSAVKYYIENSPEEG